MKRSNLSLLLLAAILLIGCDGPSDLSSSIPDDSSSESIGDTSSGWSHEIPTSETTPATPYAGEGATAYYETIPNVDVLQGSNLAAALRKKGRDVFQGKTYTQAIDAIIEMDIDLNNPDYVIGVYSRLRIPVNKRQTNVNTQIVGYWNREHCYPQSKLADGDDSKRADAQRVNISSDIANLFAEDVTVNEARSNNSFNNLDKTAERFFVKDGHGNTTDNYNWMGFFEPTDLAKGEAARANLYMHLMYPDECAVGENGPIHVFLEWNLQFPPNVERDQLRNQTIFKYQKNRNPFIDDPDFGCRIWGDTNKLTRAVCGLE
ncbi:MAG: endonuclease [Bacilli bacterium]